MSTPTHPAQHDDGEMAEIISSLDELEKAIKARDVAAIERHYDATRKAVDACARTMRHAAHGAH